MSLVWAFVACPSSSAGAQPPAERVERDFRAYGAAQVERDLISIDDLLLSSMNTPCTLATLQGRALPVRAVYARTSSEWSLVWMDGEPVVGSLPLKLELRAPPRGPDGLRAVSSDVLRLLGDPNPTYALVLESVGDIPLDRPNSDYLRHLVREGLDEAARRREMLRKVDFEIGPPARGVGDPRALVFYSWSYFGGKVKKWTCRIDGSTLTVQKAELLASEVGSFDLFP